MTFRIEDYKGFKDDSLIEFSSVDQEVDVLHTIITEYDVRGKSTQRAQTFTFSQLDAQIADLNKQKQDIDTRIAAIQLLKDDAIAFEEE